MTACKENRCATTISLLRGRCGEGPEAVFVVDARICVRPDRRGNTGESRTVACGRGDDGAVVVRRRPAPR